MHECVISQPKQCPRQVPDRMLMCAPHWRLVPKPLSDEVYRTYNGRRAKPNDPAAIMEHRRSCAEAVKAATEQIKAGGEPRGYGRASAQGPMFVE